MRTSMHLSDLLRPEARLILQGVRLKREDSAPQRIERLLEASLDWPFILQQAEHHGVTPLLAANLQKVPGSLVPTEIMSRLAAHAKQVAFHNLAQTKELLRIVDLFEEKGVAVIPFKGPALAASIYGNPAYRTYLDIDLLVRRADFADAKALLLQNGYTPYRDLSPAEESAHLDSRLGYEFVHREHLTVVELHWAFMNEIYAFELDPEGVWDRHVRVHFGGRAVRAICPEDLLLYLCVHGNKHRWRKLYWIGDVAALLHAVPELDWPCVLRRARALGVRRVVYLGLYLAHELLGAPVPEAVLRRVFRRRAVRRMGRHVVRTWLFRGLEEPPSSEAEIFLYHVREREHWKHRVRYVLHYLRLAVTPNEEDRALLRLPSFLSFLYYLLRPLRLLTGLHRPRREHL